MLIWNYLKTTQPERGRERNARSYAPLVQFKVYQSKEKQNTSSEIKTLIMERMSLHATSDQQ
jgi:hypothetical protein